MKMGSFLTSVFVAILCLNLAGCPAAFLAAGVAGVASIEDKVETDIAVSPGVSKQTLLGLNRVAVFLQTKASEGQYATKNTSPHPESVGVEGQGYKRTQFQLLDQLLSDYTALHLMKIGYDVVERNQLEAVVEEQALHQTGLLDERNLIKAGKVLGVQAIIIGSYVPSQKINFGISKGGAVTNTVKQATLKLVSVNEGRTLVLAIVDYKGAGGEFKEVAKYLAGLINSQIKDDVASTPSADKSVVETTQQGSEEATPIDQ